MTGTEHYKRLFIGIWIQAPDFLCLPPILSLRFAAKKMSIVFSKPIWLKALKFGKPVALARVGF